MPRDLISDSLVGSISNQMTFLCLKAESALPRHENHCNFSATLPNNIAFYKIIETFQLKNYLTRDIDTMFYDNRCSGIHKVSHLASDRKRSALDPYVSDMRFQLRPLIWHLAHFRSYSDVCRNGFGPLFSSVMHGSSYGLVRDIRSQPNGLSMRALVEVTASMILPLHGGVNLELFDKEHTPAFVLNILALVFTKWRGRGMGFYQVALENF